MTERLAPPITRLNAPFWEAAECDRLVLPWCQTTQRFFWPPSPWSPFAMDRDVVWREAPRDGRVIARVVFRRAFHNGLAPGPHGVVQVKLDVGPTLQAFLPNPDAERAPRVGHRVALHFVALADGLPAIPQAQGVTP
ncbi:MAG: OB-fold domain-containing protein [Pseudomonadota bacterium]|jgi:uncharacterized OB-fold protein